MSKPSSSVPLSHAGEERGKQSWRSRRHGGAKFIVDGLFLAALIAYILAGVPLTPFHGDESTLIYMSRDFAYQFLQGDLDLVTYHDPPINATEQELRLLNGTIPKYLFGLAWHAAGFTIDDINEQWDWGADWHYNQTTGHAPAAALLQTARWASAIPFAMGVIFIFLIGWQLGGRPAAYLAALFYALSPVLLLNGRRAMMEGAFIAFSLLAVLAALWWGRWSAGTYSKAAAASPRLRSWAAALLLGAAAGCALASKHTALFTITAVYAACAVIILARLVTQPRSSTPSPESTPQDIDHKRRYGHAAASTLQILCAGIITLTIFYALNPAWWGNPIERAREVLAMRQSLLEGQTAFFGGYSDAGSAVVGFFRQTFPGIPQYFEAAGWETWIGDQIAIYESSPWRGVGSGAAGGIILLALTVIGFAQVLRSPQVAFSTRAVIVFWSAAALLSVVLLTPVEWGRYYLPFLLPVGVLASFGAVCAARWARIFAQNIRT